MPDTLAQPDPARRARRAGLPWKLFGLYAAISLAAAAILARQFSREYEQLLLRQVDAKLRAAAAAAGQFLADRWPSEPGAEIQALTRRVGAGAGVRLTLIALDGRVLADSARASVDEVRSMENHRDRPEIIEARRTGSGLSRRDSPTVTRRQCYHALRVDLSGKPRGIVRTSLPSLDVDSEISGLKRWIWTSGLVAALAATALASWITIAAAAPLRRLGDAAHALLVGDYDYRLPVKSFEGDFGVVARALSEANARLARGEHQLRRTSQTQATVLEGMTESVIAVDRGAHVLFANAAAGRMLGFRPEKVEGLPMLEVVRSHELRSAVQTALGSQQLANCELTWRAGAPRTFDVLAAPLPGDPPPGVVLVLRDVSELKRVERMRQQFIANVSHELKTPLSSIRAYTETLLNGARNDATHCERFLLRIEEQTARLQRLIMDMLSLARIEMGQAALELADVSVARVVGRCLADYEPQAVAHELVLENNADDANLKVRADEEGLRQILGNLIDNAIKYTPAGGRVTVRAQPTDGSVTIAVTDTGIGIAPEHHARLFERFYRVDKARSRELGGTGLGLAIVKHICQAMGGSVAVESQPRHGSTFSVTLPRGS